MATAEDVCKPTSGQRNVQIFLLFLGTATAYTSRFSMSVAIVAMTSNSSNTDHKIYDWDTGTSNSIQSAFFWGYVVAQVPSTYIISGWSAHKLLALGMLTCSVVNMAIPLASDLGYVAVMGCRIVMGLSQACLMPCAHTLLSRWVSPIDRGRFGKISSHNEEILRKLSSLPTISVQEICTSETRGGNIMTVWSEMRSCSKGMTAESESSKKKTFAPVFSYALAESSLWYIDGTLVMNGPQFGTVLALFTSGFLASSTLGWPSIFYCFGIVGIVWSVAFYLLGADYPLLMRSKHLEERAKMAKLKKIEVPWKAILSSPPMWALIITQCGNDFGFYTWLTQLPTYMKSILHYDISKNGAVSALPYLTMWLLGFPISFASDFALRRGFTIGFSRKICNTIGQWVPAVAMLALALMETKDEIIIVAVIVVAIGFNSAACCGFLINHIDLSPHYSGQMMSITNGLSNVLGIVAPKVCGIIVYDKENESRWHIIFYITAFIYFGSNLIFLIFGRADVQPWDESSIDDTNDKSRRRLSVTSIAIEPTAVAVPESSDEDDSKTHC